ncbi:MAG: hypothetical protein DRP15_01080, partial [Candidatus Aenigmatarchaeota archaeon]
GNTGSAYSMDIDYDVDAVCNTPHYTAFYFYKECYLPMEWSVWTQCEYTYSANVNFIKKSDCKAEISSVDTPLSVQTGEQVEIVANVKSVLIDPGTTPIYVPPHRKEYYSSNVIVTLTVEKNGVNVHTESKTVSIYMSTTEAVKFYWIPTEGGTYTIHITTNVDDCKCSSSLEDSVERRLEVTGPEQHYPVIDEMQILPLHPDENDDIYCTVNVSDEDGDLDRIAFEWKVNNASVRYETKNVDSYEDNVYDVLSSDYINTYDTVTCSVTVYDSIGHSATEDLSVNIGEHYNEVPNITVTLLPQNPGTEDDITCSAIVSDSDANLDHVMFRWFVDGTLVREENFPVSGFYDVVEDTLSHVYTDTGDVVRCEAYVYDSEMESDSDHDTVTVISSAAPEIEYINIIPTDPKTQDDIICEAQVQDQDGNLDRVEFQWYINFDLVRIEVKDADGYYYSGSDVLDHTYTNYGDVVRCVIKAIDSEGLEDQETSQVSIQGNTHPVIENIPDMYTTVGETISSIDLYQYAYDAEDPVNKLTFSIQEETNPYVIDCWVNNNRYLTCSAARVTGYSDITVRVTDSQGLWDTDTFRINVGTQTNYPEITSITIEPVNPVTYDDLTCRIEMQDRDGDLDHVNIRWYLNGVMIKDLTRYVHGYSDVVYDVLSSVYTDNGDIARCEAYVYDSSGRSDYGDASVTVGYLHTCGVDVYGLRVENDRIKGYIANTGRSTEIIQYWFYVDDILVGSGTLTLGSGSSSEVTTPYDFVQGNHEVKLKATSDCGAIDYQTMMYVVGGECEEGYLDEYRCSGNWIQRRYRYENCTLVWLNYDYCPQGCVDGYCVSYSPDCGISVESFNYASVVALGGYGYVTLNIRNTGTNEEDITIEVYLDDVLRGSHTRSVNPNERFTWTFHYLPTIGTHHLRVEVTSSCGARVVRTGTVYVKEQYPSQPVVGTKIDIYPTTLDIPECSTKTIVIDISSAIDQVFSVNVTGGIPNEWVKYTKEVEIKAGKKKLYVYVSPLEKGKYTFTVFVEAKGEGIKKSQPVSIYVSPMKKASATDVTGGITGAFISASKDVWFWITVIVISLGVVLAVGMKWLKYWKKPTDRFKKLS